MQTSYPNPAVLDNPHEEVLDSNAQRLRQEILPCDAPADPSQVALQLRLRFFGFLFPLLQGLDDQIDRRLVRTFWCTLEAIVRFRNRAHGLLLSELGGYLMEPEHAPAGTKRLSNLLRSPKWTSKIIERFLWDQADQRHRQLQEGDEKSLLIWDESDLEKAESLHSEGLCAVRSSKAKRLCRIKPGFYTPPTGKPIFVPGLCWIALLLMGPAGPPTVAVMQWWTTRGVWAQDKRTLQERLLAQCQSAWEQTVVHVFDRGYAGAPWLAVLRTYAARFVMRWPKRYKLCAGADPLWTPQSAWRLVQGKRSMDHRLLRDTRRNCWRKAGIVFTRVWTTDTRQRLTLVVCRMGDAMEPWYLLTNEPVETVEDAWEIVRMYARRWQIEMAFRFCKSELSMESPRLWSWERRLKLLLMVTLVYAFLLTLLTWEAAALCNWLLRHYCHRTGKRSRQMAAPLYRLRSAISRLWNAYPKATWQQVQTNSG
jgi:hypothetical protein